MDRRAYIFAGGGTGGHIFPAIAIAQELRRREPGARIVFVGSRDKIEARVAPQNGFEFFPIWISGFQRRKLGANLLFPFKLMTAVMQSRAIIANVKPAVVIGTGGYVSGPVVYAATMKRVPTLIQDQNSAPGATSKMLASRANEVHLTFESARKFLKRQDNVFVSGNPTRDSLDNVSRREALKFFGFDADSGAKILLVFGGSLGARTINNAAAAAMERWLGRGYRVLWQTGPDADELKNRFSGAKNLWIAPFIDRMDFAYAAADAVVCRAGATTIAELTRLGKVSILIPYPFAAANHQVENANVLVNAGAARMISDADASSSLASAVMDLLDDPEKCAVMSAKCKSFGKPRAASDLADHVIALAVHGN